MVGSVNKTILLGNLGRDPEIRSMQSGAKMASFSIATSKRWKDRNTQEQKEKTSWHNIVVFGDGLVDIVEKYVESLSAYARQFLQMMNKPDVDSIDGLSPAISIEQKTTQKNPRSTVCLLDTSPRPRDGLLSRMPSSA